MSALLLDENLTAIVVGVMLCARQREALQALERKLKLASTFLL